MGKSRKGVLDLSDVLEDFNALVEAQKVGVDPTGMELPSGRILHNPVKKKVKDPTRWAAQQVDNAKAASADWMSGVENPSRNPVEAALDAKDKWLDKLTTAIKEDKWARRLAKVSPADIIAIARKVGPSGFEAGIEARRDKVAKFVREVHPLFQAVSDAIQALPVKTDADREKRLLSARKLMIELGKKRG